MREGGEGRVGVADRTLDVLEAVRDAGTASLPAVAAACGLPLPTVHRMAKALIERGYLVAYRRGLCGLGPACLTLGAGLSLNAMLREAGAAELKSLARACGTHAHLGVFEGDMVTYLAKARHGRSELPTTEGTQLEAYCSGIGKVLLAQFEAAELDRYLGQGAFVSLTDATVTDPAALRALIATARARGWATDMGEVMPDLFCVAVPVRDAAGHGVAALSVSYRAPAMAEDELAASLPALREAAGRIEAKLFR
ncbi:IclR family transcriptional regulator [Sphingoaurantiacus capsulatus]|uniref:IclR family transcriptional regulator n=1 Tax=Sphingoaurantiacus capsulatus TaxID=1771310 RepID=A0ABV7XD66_9SPHN